MPRQAWTSCATARPRLPTINPRGPEMSCGRVSRDQHQPRPAATSCHRPTFSGSSGEGSAPGRTPAAKDPHGRPPRRTRLLCRPRHLADRVTPPARSVGRTTWLTPPRCPCQNAASSSGRVRRAVLFRSATAARLGRPREKWRGAYSGQRSRCFDGPGGAQPSGPVRSGGAPFRNAAVRMSDGWDPTER